MFVVDVEVRDAGELGMGVFAKQFIPKGEMVFKMTAESVSVYFKEELDSLPARFVDDYLRKYAYCSDDGFVFFPCLDDRFLNHSYNPNIEKQGPHGIAGDDYALRDIQPGEQIFCDYTKLDESGEFCSSFLHR